MSPALPPMTFRVEDLLDADRMLNGPLVVYWGQENEEFSRSELTFGDRPKPGVLARLTRRRPFRLSVRVQPPAGVDLAGYGQDIARILGLAYGGDPRPGDRAIWLPGSVFAKNAPQAMASARRIFDRLGGLGASAVQIRVEAWS